MIAQHNEYLMELTFKQQKITAADNLGNNSNAQPEVWSVT